MSSYFISNLLFLSFLTISFFLSFYFLSYICLYLFSFQRYFNEFISFLKIVYIFLTAKYYIYFFYLTFLFVPCCTIFFCTKLDLLINEFYCFHLSTIYDILLNIHFHVRIWKKIQNWNEYYFWTVHFHRSYFLAVHNIASLLKQKHCPVGWGCRIHRLLLCSGVRPPPPTSVLDMTLNNLMERFQQCWSFGECGVPLHCHRSQVHSGPGVVASDRALSMG